MKKLIVILFSLLTINIYAQQKYALVIGNGNYASITKLNNPVNDANDIKTALESLGWTVDILRDANQEQIDSAVIRLKNRLSASRNSYGFVFYAGHGVQSNGVNYLIPADANYQSEAIMKSRAVSVQVRNCPKIKYTIMIIFLEIFYSSIFQEPHTQKYSRFPFLHRRFYAL